MSTDRKSRKAQPQTPQKPEADAAQQRRRPRGSAVRTGAGKVPRVERGRVEAELRRKEHQQGLVLHSMPAIFYTARAFGDMGTIWVSEQVERITGMAPERFTENPSFWTERLHPDDRERALDQYRAVLEKGSADMEYRWQCADGTFRWFSEHDVLIQDDQDKPKEIMGLWIDITERKQAEEAIRKSEEAHRLFSNRLTVLLSTLNELSKAESFDDLCRLAVELARQRLHFDRVGLWFLDEGLGCLRGSFGTDERGDLRDERSRHLPLDDPHMGSILQSRVSFLLFVNEPLRDHAGEIVGSGDHALVELWNGEKVIGILGMDNQLNHRPITDDDMKLLRLYATSLGHLCTLKRAEDSLRESAAEARALAEEKAHLLDEVNHRVGNNLALIRGILSMEMQEDVPESTRQVLLDMQERIHSMAGVHRILSESQWKSPSLDDLADRIIRGALSGSSIRDGIHVGVAAPEQPIPLNSKQAVKVGLILNELTTNSVKHAFGGRERGSIVVRIETVGPAENAGPSPDTRRKIRIEFQDDGSGWPEDVLNGSRDGIGLRLIGIMARDDLDGELTFRNDGGAVADMILRLDPVD
jgi:PAS domain S-box-containing protein